ncbi:MAG: hypothetical protein ABJD97_22415 [Betaproteobacteria bacterium]
MRVIFLASCLLAIAGCASAPPVVNAVTAPVVVASENGSLAADSKLVCHKEAQTGSSMIHTVCETEQSAADRIATQERMRNMAPNNSIAHPAPGNP